MNGHFETNGIYPLSTEPAEGYIGDPMERSGKKILIHAHAGKFVKLDTSEQGYTLVADRSNATQFDNDSVASLEAGKLIQAVRNKAAQKLAA